MGEETSLVTVEIDDDRAAASARLFADLPNVQVLHGDWHDVLPPARRSTFCSSTEGDGSAARLHQMRAESERALDLVAAGGVVAMDNLTPEHLWPPDAPDWPNALREFWLGNAVLLAMELLTTPDTSVILAVKR